MTKFAPQSTNKLELAQLHTLDRIQCLDRWKERFGRLPPKHLSLVFMRRALAYETQLDAIAGFPVHLDRALKVALKQQRTSGGIDAGHRTRRSDLTQSPPSENGAPLVLSVGTQLVREYQGRTYHVEVLEDGFLMDGKHYRSLTALAQRITGTRWSGPRFFGLAR